MTRGLKKVEMTESEKQLNNVYGFTALLLTTDEYFFYVKDFPSFPPRVSLRINSSYVEVRENFIYKRLFNQYES